MLPETEVLKILNHNGSNRRYSKEQAKIISAFLNELANELVKEVSNKEMKNKIKSNTHK